MKCEIQNCEADATIHVRDHEMDGIRERHLCMAHAEEAGYFRSDVALSAPNALLERVRLPRRLMHINSSWCISLGQSTPQQIFSQFGFLACDCGDGFIRAVFPDDHLSVTDFEKAVFVFGLDVEKIDVMVASRDEINRVLNGIVL